MISSASRPSPPSSPTPAVLIEDHDGAYWAWKRAALKDRVLFHFDAHIDFAWILPAAASLLGEGSLREAKARAAASPLWDLTTLDSEQRTHLGNYVHQAMEAGIVREFVWVYPDGEDAFAQAAAVRGILDSLARQRPGLLALESQEIDGAFAGTIHGRPFRALPLSALGRAAAEQPVLLDVDVDFFVIRDLHAPAYPFHEPGSAGCWLSPADLLRRVRDAGLRFDFATIAYSVEEGYTPIGLKFLGDELLRRIQGTPAAAEERRWGLLRRIHDRAGGLALHEKLGLLERESRLGRAPELDFNAALLCAEAGEFDAARRRYEAAVAADPSYRTRYNHEGPVLLARGRRREAEASFSRMRRLDPAHPAYRLFELETRLEREDFKGAAALGEALFADGVREPGLMLSMAEAHLDLRDFGRAWTWLGMSGEAPLKPYDRPRYWALRARAAEGLGQEETALDAYHRVTQCPIREPQAHWSLARLYLRRRNFYKARRHAWMALRQRAA